MTDVYSELISGQPTAKAGKKSQAEEMAFMLGKQAARAQQKLEEIQHQRLQAQQDSLNTMKSMATQMQMLSNTQSQISDMLAQANQIKGEIENQAQEIQRGKLNDMAMIPGQPPMDALQGLPPLGEPPAAAPDPQMMAAMGAPPGAPPGPVDTSGGEVQLPPIY